MNTFAVQSFHVTLESPPLEANTVGQLLTGVNTEELNAVFTALKDLLVPL